MNIHELVDRYRAERSSCLRAGYNETQVRNDYINPFLKCLGWDVDNEQGKNHFLRDVLQEEYIDVEDENSKKNPDYTLRVHGSRKLFVEVKKPSVRITASARAAFQTRRYGWNANLGLSILTNFEHLILYDCRFKPDVSENEQVARYRIFSFEEYVDSWNEIQELISFQSAISGRLDELFSLLDRRGQTFDEYFLRQIVKWREKLAITALEKNEGLNEDDLNFLIQRLLNRIIFLRICEDRTIEKFETLKNIENYNELKSLFQQSDKKFNSGLFDFIEDNLSLTIDIDSQVLIEIFNELYYPLSPYDFSVVDPSILSQIYERFLGSRIGMDEDRQLMMFEEPEVSASNGVVPTPKIIVEQIIKDTLGPLLEGKSVSELSEMKVADICCGSGTFLISTFDFMQRTYLERLVSEKADYPESIHQINESSWSLTLKAKREILEKNIYGVDVNPYAAEVSEFSLLLKLLEGESKATVDSFIDQHSQKVLPNLKGNVKCGNSLVDSNFFKIYPKALSDDTLLHKVNPFDWGREFGFLANSTGFDAIVGNPPYVRIQNMVKFAKEEVEFYQSSVSGYSVSKSDTIDKYYVFIERALSLLNKQGRLGYIIPHKFFLIKGGKSLRNLISTHAQIAKITHFGVAQVFPGRSTYTAILILQKDKSESFEFKKVRKISVESLENIRDIILYDSAEFKSEPWIFLSPGTKSIFNKLISHRTRPLKIFAEICVGLQTSADKIYIFVPEGETSNTYKFSKGGVTWEVEKGICQPAIYDLTFGVFDTIDGNAQMIFPYTVAGDSANLFEEDFFQDNFPLAYAYLNSQKEKLKKRNLQGKEPKWYQFGRSQSLVKFIGKPKLIWSVLATSAPYTLDSNSLLFTGGGNGPYYGLINNSMFELEYFLGILAHPLFEAMVKSGASEFRGSYYSHGKQFLENLPIWEVDISDPSELEKYQEIISLVRELILTQANLKASAYGSKRNVYERKKQLLINQLIHSVNHLYGISEQDYEAVLDDEMFTTDLALED
ncbi:Eco57I restriction-modification methylase domain-containing protein [Algoriphagus confluentis]|uniref:site-specific DNA-methyltransferase (adenine-specific) n=1 Tax=Algoriphagus confluentis TaxID=1697556 RepID=A0ABQ6PTZ3_9BACT|nr:Eco57I restriction-modification methylase domain-containing protein [Algoriphagus confluentis]